MLGKGKKPYSVYNTNYSKQSSTESCLMYLRKTDGSVFLRSSRLRVKTMLTAESGWVKTDGELLV